MSKSALLERLQSAEQLFTNGRIEDALAAYRRILDDAPDDANALNGAAAAYAKLGRLDRACDLFARALVAHPKHEPAFFNLLTLLIHTGASEEAQTVFDRFGPNVTEQPKKQTFRDRLFDRALNLTPPYPPPIAIGGCGSSGTTLLRRILDSHPEVACGKEMSVFDRPITYDLSLETLRARVEAQDFNGFDQDIPFRIAWPDGTTYFGLKRGNHGDYYHTAEEVNTLFNHATTSSEFWHLYFYSYAQMGGKTRWAEKTPNNIFFADRFLDFFPRGRFINMIRDGRDVCLSLMRRRDFALKQAIKRWTLSIEAGQRVADHDRVYTLRYEELVTRPEATLQHLMAWLDIPFDPQMLDFAKNSKEENRWGYGEQPIAADSAHRWRSAWSELPDRITNTLDASLAAPLDQLGYPAS